MSHKEFVGSVTYPVKSQSNSLYKQAIGLTNQFIDVLKKTYGLTITASVQVIIQTYQNELNFCISNYIQDEFAFIRQFEKVTNTFFDDLHNSIPVDKRKEYDSIRSEVALSILSPMNCYFSQSAKTISESSPSDSLGHFEPQN